MMSPSGDRDQSKWLEGFRNHRVLITGHTGFKGSWLLMWMIALGADVRGLALRPESESLFVAAGLDDLITSYYGDVRDLDAVRVAMGDFEPEIVFHLAAQSLVRRAYTNPVETYETNIMGTVNLLDAVRGTPTVRAVVVVTSDKCYENNESMWPHRETDQLGGDDPYSSSKGCAELVTAAYRRSFFTQSSPTLVATARAGNVIGGGDWAEDRLVPDIARSLAASQPVLIRNPDSVRPWQHVLEPLRGYMMLANQLARGHIVAAQDWNFGPGDAGSLSVERLAGEIIDCWGEGSMTIAREDNPPPEAHLLRLDISKATELLGYRPLIGTGEAINMTVAWYREFERDSSSARQVMESQIFDYSALID